MNTIEVTSQWMERASDRMNPILVKEVRQALKSRQFVVTFTLLLVAAWLISVFGILNAGDALEYGATGRGFFALYYCVLATAIFVIVPFGAYRSLLTERDQNTFELLSITTLSPRRIVYGKLASALVQVFIYYSAIAPFIAFTSLLQGFDFAQVLFVLVVSILFSLGCSAVALMLSTVAKQKTWQGLISVGVLGGLVWLIILVYSMTAFLLFEPIPFDDPDFWWGVGFTLMIGLSYLVLAIQITAAQLTFESDNRSTAIRITCSAQFWLLWLGIFAYGVVNHSFSHVRSDEILVFSILSAIHWSVVGVFAVTETDAISRRVRRGIPRNRLLRLVIVPFLPGGHRGWLFLIIHVAALAAVAIGMGSLGSGVKDSVFGGIIALCCYIVIYLGLGRLLGVIASKFFAEVRPAHVRVMTLILFAVGAIAPYLPYALGLMRWYPGYSLTYITNVFVTLEAMFDSSHYMPAVLLVLLVAAGLVIVLNLRMTLAGVTEIVAAPSSQQAQETPEDHAS